MLLLKSLFCLSGSDNRHRFIVIQLSCYLLFSLTSALFSFSGFLSFFSLCLFTAISTLSTKRRINDANLHIKWLLAASASFIIAGTIILISGAITSYWLLLGPTVISSLLVTYKSKNNNHIFGYHGDIDLSSLLQQGSYQNQVRIEPTFNQEESGQSRAGIYEDANSTFIKNANTSVNRNTSDELDIGEVIRLKLLNNKNALLALAVLISIVVLALLFSSSSSSIDDENQNLRENEITTDPESKQVFLHEITLPDDFTLFVSSFNGITIKWQGDASPEDFLWQQLTAQGDESCKVITYNNGEKVRTLNVLLENNGDYLANFSPLDTKALIKNIANRSSFSLCGYKFSLKGSQAILGKHSYYSEFIAN